MMRVWVATVLVGINLALAAMWIVVIADAAANAIGAPTAPVVVEKAGE